MFVVQLACATSEISGKEVDHLAVGVGHASSDLWVAKVTPVEVSVIAGLLGLLYKQLRKQTV